MDMSGMSDSSSTGTGSMTMSSLSSMPMVFYSSTTTPLFSRLWAPTTDAGYAGTCIFLIVLATILRLLIASRHLLEHWWLARARRRRYVVVRGEPMAADALVQDPDAKLARLLSERGEEENVHVVRAAHRPVLPWRLSVDVPRATLATVTAGLSYLLMLAVMTYNVGYFMSVLAGTFIGELAVGRYITIEDHH